MAAAPYFAYKKGRCPRAVVGLHGCRPELAFELGQRRSGLPAVAPVRWIPSSAGISPEVSTQDTLRWLGQEAFGPILRVIGLQRALARCALLRRCHRNRVQHFALGVAFDNRKGHLNLQPASALM
jgi:hypothetical protein